MKTAATLLLLLSPAFCCAETFIMKDGARIEGEVTGEMDGALLITTKYGSLTVIKTDISERQPSAAPAPVTEPAAAAAPTAQPAEAAVSTAAPAALPEAPVSTAAASEPPVAAPIDNTKRAPFVFISLPAEAGARKLVYYENGAPIASELISATGVTVSTGGFIKDATYSEFYDTGAIKTVKPMAAGKPSGAVKTYYPTGIPQIEAAYLGGARNGTFIYFSEDGSPMLEAVYAGDKLNGWRKEYGPDGAVTSEIFYVDDKPADQPQKKAVAPATPAAAKEEDSLVTAKAVTVARGEVVSFSFNGKYIGKVRLDRDCNVLGQEGKVPDGTVKVYTKDEKLQKELVFKNGEIKIIRAYEEGGPLKATYTVNEGKASSFTLK